MLIAAFISFIRLIMALCFLFASKDYRIIYVLVAIISDFLDGYVARKLNAESKFGSILDPIMDKIFVSSLIIKFYQENMISYFGILSFFFRDFLLLILFLAMFYIYKKRNITFGSVFWSKVTTCFQFAFLLLILMDIKFPEYFYFVFYITSFLSLIKFSKKFDLQK